MLRPEITFMKIDDIVRIYPHGSPATAVRARVIIVSSNGLSVGVDFETPPPFYRGDETGIFVHRVTGRVTMMLMRRELYGAPWGPWVEVTGGGHYEIEEDLQ
jgi:hypothetical protein